MKRFTTILAAAALLLTSCEEYLDVKPRGYDIASKVEHYEGLLIGQDLCLLDECFPYMCFDCHMDPEGFENVYSTIGSSATKAYKWEKDVYREDETCGEWNSFTTALYYYNMVINGVPDAEDGTPEKRLALQAEARMLRAYCTFLMSEFFGDVPIITTASTMDGDYSLHSRDEVVEFVLTEMGEAVGQLEDATAHCKRVFRTAGLALYGRVLFQYGMYERALEQLGLSFEAVKESPELGLVDWNPRMDSNGEVDLIVYDYENHEQLFCLTSMSSI